MLPSPDSTDAAPRRALWLALSAAALALAGCASVPPPNDAMARAQSQLQAARDAGAADADPVDLDFATSKLQKAQVAMSAKKYGKAADLAAESHADAQLAFTKARLASLREQIRKRSADNAQLRSQLLDRRQELDDAQKAIDQGGTELPEQVLPQPAAPAAAASSAAPAPAPATPGSAPAPASTAPLHGNGGDR